MACVTCCWEAPQDEHQGWTTRHGKLELIIDTKKQFPSQSKFQKGGEAKLESATLWKSCTVKKYLKWSVIGGARGVRRRFCLVLFSRMGGITACLYSDGTTRERPILTKGHHQSSVLEQTRVNGVQCTVDRVALDRAQQFIYSKRLRWTLGRGSRILFLHRDRW